MSSATIAVSAERLLTCRPEARLLEVWLHASFLSRDVSSGGDGVMASPDDIPPSLEADVAALRKLRDDDASGALTELFGGGEDP